VCSTKSGFARRADSGTPRPSASVALARRDLPEVGGPLGRHLPSRSVLEGVENAASEVRAGIAGQGEMVDVRGSKTRGLEAVADRAVRERGLVLNAGEALFLDRGHEAAVHDDRR
jgi:hypothetical protein